MFSFHRSTSYLPRNSLSSSNQRIKNLNISALLHRTSFARFCPIIFLHILQENLNKSKHWCKIPSQSYTSFSKCNFWQRIFTEILVQIFLMNIYLQMLILDGIVFHDLFWACVQQSFFLRLRDYTVRLSTCWRA